MAQVQIAEFETVVSQYQGDAPLYFADYATEDIAWENRDDVIPKGDPFTNNKWAGIVTCTVDGSGNVVVPTRARQATEDSINPNVTMVSYFLDEKFRPVGGSSAQPFGRPYRIPVQPASTKQANLFLNVGTVSPLPIDASEVRTQGYYQIYDTSKGLKNGDIRKDGGTTRVTGHLAATGNVTGANVSATSAVSSATSSTSSDAAIGRDANVTRDVNAGRNVTAQHFIGEGSGITGVTAAGVGGSSSTGSLSLIADSDNTNAGEVIDEILGSMGSAFLAARTSRTLKESYVPLYAEMHDNGGLWIDVKTRGAVPGTDCTAAIDQSIADAKLIGAGVRFSRADAPYKTTGEHQTFSGLLIAGVSGAYPDVPYGDVGQPAGASVIQLTASDACVFRISPHVEQVTIRDISAKADSLVGTQFILAQGSAPDGASKGHFFQNICTVGFRAGLEVQGSDVDGEWQFDRWTASHCAFLGGTYAIYLNSQNCDQVFIVNCQLGAPAGMNYGLYCEKVGTITVDTCYGAGGGANSRSLFFFTPYRDTVVIRNCWCEPFDRFLDLEDNAITTLSKPITLISNGVGLIYLGHSAALVSLGNKYYGAGCVTVGALSGNNFIHSYGDQNVDLSDPDTPISDSPFNMVVPGLGTTGANCVTEIGTLRNVIDARYGGLTVNGHTAVGDGAPITGAIMRVVPTGAEAASDKPLMRLESNSPSIYLDIIRQSADGVYKFHSNQGGGFSGFMFAGSRMGFYDHAAVGQQVIGAAATDAASTMALANTIRTILLNLGLAKVS